MRLPTITSALTVMPGISRKSAGTSRKSRGPSATRARKNAERPSLAVSSRFAFVGLQRVLGDHTQRAVEGAVALEGKRIELDPHRVAHPQTADVGASTSTSASIWLSSGTRVISGSASLATEPIQRCAELEDHAVRRRAQHHQGPTALGGLRAAGVAVASSARTWDELLARLAQPVVDVSSPSARAWTRAAATAPSPGIAFSAS